ncbi:MAG TPA: threonine-phosphate decarboxylase [Desulfosarcina sp.]|nr:threonine-phosphate decarboxylase [Desulfosarcina sp.]
MIGGHGGNIYELAARLDCDPFDIEDMSSNVNPLGPPEGLAAFLQKQLGRIAALPEADAGTAVRAFARRHGISPDRVLAGNGTTQFIHDLPLALGSRRVLILGPTYADYADACRMHGVPFTFLHALPQTGFRPDPNRLDALLPGHDTVFVCNPNNPTGALIPGRDLAALAVARRDVRFIVDESYLPFVAAEAEHTLVREDLPNLIVLNSMSKIFRVPGLRIGFMVVPTAIRDRAARYCVPWSVNSLAQAAAAYLMTATAETDAFVRESREFLNLEREGFRESLADIAGLRLFNSTTSFVLAELTGDVRAEAVCEALAGQRILIRNCANFEGLSHRFIRVSLKSAAANRRLAEALKLFFAA